MPDLNAFPYVAHWPRLNPDRSINHAADIAAAARDAADQAADEVADGAAADAVYGREDAGWGR